MKRIIFTRPDGGLTVVVPNIDTYPERENITEDEALKRAWNKNVPADAINPQIVEAAAIPIDRTFRNAWIAGDGSVTHDMEKCRAIHRDTLRALRAPKLACLDVEFQRSYKDPARLDVIEAEKQALRDVTKDPAIDAATTPEELKLAVPAVLSAPG